MSIALSKSREVEIQSCFNYAKDIEDLKQLIETSKLTTESFAEKNDFSSSIYGENR